MSTCIIDSCIKVKKSKEYRRLRVSRDRVTPLKRGPELVDLRLYLRDAHADGDDPLYMVLLRLFDVTDATADASHHSPEH